MPESHLKEPSQLQLNNENPAECLPLYDGASTTLLEALAKHFQWFTAHPGTSKEALSELVCTEHSILPEGNLMPTSYASAYRLIKPYLAESIEFHACTNDCILFRDKYEKCTECPICKSPRYKPEGNENPYRKFLYLPLQPRLTRMFGYKNVAEAIQSHLGSLESSSPLMYDIHDSPIWKSSYSLFNGDKRGLSFAFCTDGVNPFSHNRVKYSMWPIMVTLLNLPRKCRNSVNNIFLLGIVLSNDNQEPKHLDPYLSVAVDKLLMLSSVQMYDAFRDECFQLKVEVLVYILDYPGMGKVLRMCGSGAYKGCIWCEIKGVYYVCVTISVCIHRYQGYNNLIIKLHISVHYIGDINDHHALLITIHI